MHTKTKTAQYRKYILNIFLKNLIKLILTLCIVQQIIPQHTLAHSIKQTTARVILRDGQIEIRIHTNLATWGEKLQDNQAWLLGEIDNILPKNATNKETFNFLKNQIKKNTHIEVMGKELPLQIAKFPDKISDAHDDNTDIVLTTQHTYQNVKNITIQFPKSLGSVYTTFVKPQYRMITANKKTKIYFSP